MTRRLVFALVLALCPWSVGTLRAQTELRGLIVLIDYPSEAGEDATPIPIGRVRNIINGVDYTEPNVTRSLRDYWTAQSRGNVTLTHDVFGYFTAPHPASYYNARTFAEFIALTRDALDWVVATNPGYDWDSLSLASGDMNRTGIEEGTFLAVSFLSTEWIPGIGGTHHLTGWTAPNGVRPQQIVGATLQAPWDTNVNLFWLTHELGHSIWGWPDIYDNTGASHGTGRYSVMSGNQGTGDIEPVGAPFLAAEGWVDVVDIARRNTMIKMTADGDTVARYVNPSVPAEYFILEARSNETPGNAAFPVPQGILIWHVDDRVTTRNTKPQMTTAEHYQMSIEQADGRFDLERFVNSGDADDIYVAGDSFGDETTPGSRWWDGTPSLLTIGDITFKKNGTITLRATIR